MATVRSTDGARTNGYPTTDGKPLAETDQHRDQMVALIETLKTFYHDAPDVFVVKGVPKKQRLNYLVWEEGKAPAFVVELTSSSTRHEDRTRKFALYRDTLRVKEYFLFDVLGDYLDPPLQGYRLRGGQYRAIRPVAGRLPSQVLNLHLERHAQEVRLFDPAAGRWLPTPAERLEQTSQRLQQAEAENLRLRRQLEQQRQQFGEQRHQLGEQRQELDEQGRQIGELRRQMDELRRRLEEQN
jgi:hypothetical protein